MTKMRYPKFEKGQLFREVKENYHLWLYGTTDVEVRYERYMILVEIEKQLWLCTATFPDGHKEMIHAGLTYRGTRNSLLMEMPETLLYVPDENECNTIKEELKELFGKWIINGETRRDH